MFGTTKIDMNQITQERSEYINGILLGVAMKYGFNKSIKQILAKRKKQDDIINKKDALNLDYFAKTIAVDNH